MSDGTLEQFVAESKLFGMLDADGRARLIEIATQETFATGDVVMREGETGKSFYVLMSGAVSVNADNFGTDQHLADLGPGAVFGEIAALTGEPRTATVRCTEPVKALTFERDKVMAILQEYPKVLGLLNRIGLMRTEDTLEKMIESG